MGISRSGEGFEKVFLRVVERNDKETLLAIVNTTILPGTTILSSCWKYYNTQENEAFKNLTVKHSIHFKKPKNGAAFVEVKGHIYPNLTDTDEFDASLAEI